MNEYLTQQVVSIKEATHRGAGGYVEVIPGWQKIIWVRWTRKNQQVMSYAGRLTVSTVEVITDEEIDSSRTHTGGPLYTFKLDGVTYMVLNFTTEPLVDGELPMRTLFLAPVVDE
jgi:hypothetical protein